MTTELSLIENELTNCLEWEYSSDLLHEHIAQQATTIPYRCAIVSGTVHLSYKQLERCVTALASTLRDNGLKAGSRVGVYVGRNEMITISMLAVFRIRAVVVPLAKEANVERIQLICEDANIEAIIADELDANMRSIMAACVLIANSQQLMSQPEQNVEFSSSSPQDYAYILYTSGSTGRPKGVVTRHAELTNQIFAWHDYTPAIEPLVGTLLAPIIFDASIWEQFFILTWGGTLHIVNDAVRKDPQALVAYLIDHKITTTNIAPVLLPSVVSEFEGRPSEFFIKRLVVGAEAVAQSTFQRFRDLSSDLELIECYGPTEAAITATVYRFTHADDESKPVPVGLPLPGYRIYIVDSALRLVSRGETGQIAIGGQVLAVGYLNLPNETQNKFVDDPFSNIQGSKMYLTGDIGKCMADGTLLLNGRMDYQTKIRGFRVELGEIESALLKHPMVRAAVVKSFISGSGHMALVAYLQGDNLNIRDIRKRLTQHLASHMVPQYFIELPSFPLTASGKIDRLAFPAIEPQSLIELKEFELPETEMQRFVWHEWSKILGVSNFGISDAFMDIGGHSMLAIQLIAGIQEKLKIPLLYRDLLAFGTVEDLSSALEKVPGTVEAVSKILDSALYINSQARPMPSAEP